MGRLIKTSLLVAVIAAGIWALVNREQLKQPEVLLARLREKFKAATASFNSGAPLQHEPISQQWTTEPVIRVASFKLDRFGAKPDDLAQLPILADICRRYDVIALQGLDGRSDRWLEALAAGLQSLNLKADYAFITDASIQGPTPTQNAILFNRQTVELDQSKWYQVKDPDSLLDRQPLVGWFRTRIGRLDQSFTFTLANVEFNRQQDGTELAYMTELFRAIRNDGRGEDDVILAGDFNSCDQGLAVAQSSGLTWVISQCPTDVRQTAQFDNIVFQPQATIEFTGRGGILDFMRVYNLRLDVAESISKRLPIWAEFSAIEGGLPKQPFTQPRTARAQ
jgi:endonuclease/exonuclease/phosphatase family metal-dependent hydrolase